MDVMMVLDSEMIVNVRGVGGTQISQRNVWILMWGFYCNGVQKNQVFVFVKNKENILKSSVHNGKKHVTLWKSRVFTCQI